MNRTFHFLATFLFLGLSYSGQAQRIEWEYQIPIEKGSHVGNFWVEGDQININMNSLKVDYLMTLHVDGYLESMTFLNGCSDNVMLMPYTNGTLLTSGNNCFHDGNYEYDSRVYSNEGEFIKKGPGFGKGGYNFIKDETGYYILRTPNGYKFEEFTLGHIDWDFNIQESKISTRPITISNLGITPAGGQMCLTKRGEIIAGFNYGNIFKKNQLSAISGFIQAFDKENNKLKWRYPKSPDEFVLRRYKHHHNVIGILRHKACPSQYKFETVSSGIAFNSFEIKEEKDVPKDFIVSQGHLLFLHDHHISFLNYQGKEINSFDQYDEQKIFEQKRIVKIDDQNYIILCYDKEWNNAVIRKLTFEAEGDTIEEEKTEAPSISKVEVDEVDDDIITLSVFPNPASIFINFELKGEIDQNSNYNIEILGADGKSIYSQKFSDTEFELDISNFPSGQYFYRFVDTESREKTKMISGKFIKLD